MKNVLKEADKNAGTAEKLWKIIRKSICRRRRPGEYGKKALFHRDREDEISAGQQEAFVTERKEKVIQTRKNDSASVWPSLLCKLQDIDQNNPG